MSSGKSPSKSVSRHVWRLAWPTILSNLLFTTVGLAHIKIVSSLGTSAVAAVSSGHRIFFIVQAIMMGLSVATTALVSRNWGAGNVFNAQQVAWNSIIASWFMSGILMLPALLFPELLAGIFGLEAEAASQAAKLIFWLGFFTLFSATSMILYSCLRASGDVLTPLWFLLASSILNIVFSYLTTHGIGPFPALGVEGVGLGGGLAASLVTTVFFFAWIKRKFSLAAPTVKSLNRATLKQLAIIGIPAVIEQAVLQFAMLAFFVIIAGYGTEAYAALGIGISLVSFSVVIGFGFGIATTTLVGQRLGAGRPDQALKVALRAMRMGLITMTTLSVLLALLARKLAGFMIDDPQTIELTVYFIYIIAIAQPLMAVEITLGGALRGAGETRFPLLATFCGMVFGRLVPALLLSSANFPIQWIFSMLVTDYLIKAFMSYRKFAGRKWLHTLVEPKAEAEPV